LKYLLDLKLWHPLMVIRNLIDRGIIGDNDSKIFIYNISYNSTDA